LEEEVSRLKEKLETRKAVERAKGILMQTLGLSEQEAYRRIQKESMDRCLPMRAIAEAIILANELKGKK
jgi:response regulator NasT